MNKPVYIPAEPTAAERDARAAEALAYRQGIAISAASWAALVAVVLVLVLS
jgi:hypothetical protein